MTRARLHPEPTILMNLSYLSADNFIFANFSLLFGMAGLLFESSQIWNIDWWCWHVLKLIAYSFVFYYLFISYQQISSKLQKEIIERKQAEEQIKASLKEKETLLHEIHHRVKNNMQVISSLLKLQSNNIKDNQIKAVLKESQSRVYALSAVHETLHGSENLSDIELESYLSKITSSIFQTYSTSHDKVTLNTDIEKIPVGINQASPLGLIINELISNSLKYAFPDDRKGEITVSMKKQDEELEFIVRDNGVGMLDGFDWKNSNSLGLKLVRTLAENQLDGSIDMESNNGTKFTIKFNIET